MRRSFVVALALWFALCQVMEMTLALYLTKNGLKLDKEPSIEWK